MGSISRCCLGFLRRQANNVVGKASPHVYACLIIGFFMLLVNSFHLYRMSKYKDDLQAIIDDEYPKSQVNLSSYNEDPTGSFNAEDELGMQHVVIYVDRLAIEGYGVCF